MRPWVGPTLARLIYLSGIFGSSSLTLFMLTYAIPHWGPSGAGGVIFGVAAFAIGVMSITSAVYSLLQVGRVRGHNMDGHRTSHDS